MCDLNDFERRMKKELEKFQDGRSAVKVLPRQKPVVERPVKGMEVTLCVRNKKNSFLDQKYTTLVEGTISSLEAQIEATKRAREAGWQHIAYMVDYRIV